MRRATAVSIGLLLPVVVFLSSVLVAGGDTFDVSVTDSGFVPEIITVPVRSAVTWVSSGTMSHTVTALNGEFSSGVIPPGGVYSYFFAAPGEYPYRDLLSSATGKVVVGEGVYKVFLPLVMQNYGQ